MNNEDPKKLPGKEINWDDYIPNAKPEEEEVELPFEEGLWSSDTSFDMFKLSDEEKNAL